MNPQYIICELMRAGMTQTKIAHDVGIAQATVSDLSLGKIGVKRPSEHVSKGLRRLAKKHGVALKPPSTNN